MHRTIALISFLVFAIPCFASRGYVGNNSISEIMVTESSALCGPSNGACLVLFFEGGALGCSPSSQHIAISLDEPNYKTIEAMAYISLSTKKKFRTYATVESCGNSELLNPNGASIYDVAH